MDIKTLSIIEWFISILFLNDAFLLFRNKYLHIIY